MKSPLSLKTILAPCLIGSGLLTAATAQTTLDAWTTQVGPLGTFDAHVTGNSGSAFALFSSPMGESLRLGVHPVMATGHFDQFGNAQITRQFRTALTAGLGVDLHLVTRNATAATGLDVVTQPIMLSLGASGCSEFDPNFSLGQRDAITGLQVEPATGQQLSNEWSLAGMNISATNNAPGHPDIACIFDSANPTGGDGDLQTPGLGFGNNVGGFGNVIIIAENDVDGADADTFIDVPDDEELGGTIRLDFDEPYHMCSATLLDIDQDEFDTSELRFYIGDAMALETVPMQFQGDNSLQTLTFDKRDVRAFELVLAGSGALARLEMEPCPVVLNFDEAPFGKPLDLPAGTNITDQFDQVGLTVSAVNGNMAKPDMAILFDSQNPTGGDADLATFPGYHPSNTVPLGMVLVIPENDDDANGDLVVDDPNDCADGGVMTFTFDEPVTFLSAQVLDIDSGERDIFIFRDESGADIAQIDVDELPSPNDNAVQLVEPASPIVGVKTIILALDGSGALSELRWCPQEPMP